MAVVIAYQSLNSNVSSTHGIQASNSQYFTRMAHNYSAQNQQPWALVNPISDQHSATDPIQGPAQLLATAPPGHMNKGNISEDSFLGMVQGKARQIHQNIIREFGKSCDLLVLGELDSGHSDWSSMQSHAGSLVHASSPDKACNCFSIHGANSGGYNQQVGEGTGWTAVKCGNVVAVFVHVPNSIAKSENQAIDFYQKINDKVLAAGVGSIDIIMGDTNQGSAEFTPKVVSKALGTQFIDAHSDSSIAPIDAFDTSFGGTNSTSSKKYDVAVYSPASIKNIRVGYISQFSSVGSTVAAVTDHMGVCVYLEK